MGGCLRVTARGMGVGGRFPGRRGRRPLRVAREWAAAEACPSSGPAGPPSPKGEGKGCSGGIHPSRGVGGGGRSRRGGAPRPTDGDIKMLWGLRGQPFPGRRAVGAGHARPGGWREHPSMVRSVGRGLDPSAGDCPGDGRWRKVSGASGTPPPTACPGMGGSGSLPLIRPCGATFPHGGWQGLLLAAAQASAGRRGRRPLRFARGRAVTGACPSSGTAGPPSPKGEGKGCCWRRRKPAPTPAAGPRCGAGGSGCSTSGLTKPAQYRRNLGMCRGGSRR